MKMNRQTKRDAKRLYRLCLVNGLLDPDRTRKVVERVAEAKRRNRLVLLANFQHLVKLDRARHTAKVESAVPVPSDLSARIQADLAHTYGPGMTVTFAENPALIGGIRIQVGSDVFDGSIRAGLVALEKNF